jgi:hypothetical protein
MGGSIGLAPRARPGPTPTPSRTSASGVTGSSISTSTSERWFAKINERDPYAMGESIDLPRQRVLARADALENICLWCDEFFDKQFDIRTLAVRRTPEG